MADGDGPAADVHLLRVGLEQLDHRQRLGRERLVDLDQVDVVQLQPGALQGLVRAGTGPMPITDGSTPATAIARIRTFGFSPSSLARSSDMISRAAAPTLSGLALPAVTVPPSGMNAGLSAASASRLVSRRMHWSSVIDLAPAFLVAAPGRNDLLGERAGVGGLGGAAMAAQGELVLLACG